jgi:5'-nucleotidase (lipoprotein e(P4) family)
MRRWSIVLVMAVAGCATAAPAPTRAPAPAPAAAALPSGLHWFRNSAEQRALYLQTYRWAGERLAALARGAQGPWAVILDADETLLDNSEYQLREARAGLGFDNARWNAWVRERAARALPGAVEFTRGVRALGGRVVVVTNRDAVVCDDTRTNLVAVGVEADAVLCRGETGDKNPRFQAVEAGSAAPGLPPLRVLMWVGDNVQDFPGLSQELRAAPESALERFGRAFVILPNPMYGSWERNPPR